MSDEAPVIAWLRRLANGQTLVKNTVTATSSGDNVLHTPASGKKLRLHFFGYSAGVGVSGVLASLKLEGYNADAAFDQQYLTTPGQPYARNIQAGKRYIDGAVGNGSTTGRLLLNLSAAQTIYANFEIEEI